MTAILRIFGGLSVAFSLLLYQTCCGGRRLRFLCLRLLDACDSLACRLNGKRPYRFRTVYLFVFPTAAVQMLPGLLLLRFLIRPYQSRNKQSKPTEKRRTHSPTQSYPVRPKLYCFIVFIICFINPKRKGKIYDLFTENNGKSAAACCTV